jgi:hypothetical protein
VRTCCRINFAWKGILVCGYRSDFDFSSEFANSGFYIGNHWSRAWNKTLPITDLGHGIKPCLSVPSFCRYLIEMYIFHFAARRARAWRQWHLGDKFQQDRIHTQSSRLSAEQTGKTLSRYCKTGHFCVRKMFANFASGWSWNIFCWVRENVINLPC